MGPELGCLEAVYDGPARHAMRRYVCKAVQWLRENTIQPTGSDTDTAGIDLILSFTWKIDNITVHIYGMKSVNCSFTYCVHVHIVQHIYILN